MWRASTCRSVPRALSTTALARPQSLRRARFGSPKCTQSHSELTLTQSLYPFHAHWYFHSYHICTYHTQKRLNVSTHQLTFGCLPESPPPLAFSAQSVSSAICHRLRSLPWLGRFYTWRMFKRLRDNIYSARYSRNTRRFRDVS